MTVAEMIAYLQTQPQDFTVAFKCFSEARVLEADEIERMEACEPRPDGWVHDKRPDKPTRTYLMLPGN